MTMLPILFTRRKYTLFLLILSLLTSSAYAANDTNLVEKVALERIEKILSHYKQYLDKGTYDGKDFRHYQITPQSRYATFKEAFTRFARNRGKIVVETGTSRSFVTGGLPGCLSSDPQYWNPYKPENWDWGAGIFTRVAAECLASLNPQIHTIDIIAEHISRCKIMTEDFKGIIEYHVASSVDFLKKCDLVGKIDLLYLDAGDTGEECAKLQLQEVRTVVKRGLMSPHGLILIDDVKVLTTADDTTALGKAKYSIPFLLNNGFEIVMDEYQVLLRKK